MTVFSSQIWTSRSDQCHRTPFRTGVDRALADAFPPVDDDVLPDRIGAALARLDRVLAVIRPAPSDDGGPPAVAASKSR